MGVVVVVVVVVVVAAAAAAAAAAVVDIFCLSCLLKTPPNSLGKR